MIEWQQGDLLLCGDAAAEMESVLDLPEDWLFTVGSSMNRLQATYVIENRIEKKISLYFCQWGETIAELHCMGKKHLSRHLDLTKQIGLLLDNYCMGDYVSAGNRCNFSFLK